MRAATVGSLIVVLVALDLAARTPGGGAGADMTTILREEASLLDALDQTVFAIREAEVALQNALQAQAQLESRQSGALQALAAARSHEAETRARLHATLRLLAASGPPSPLHALLAGDDIVVRRHALLRRLLVRQAAEWRAYIEAADAARVVEFCVAIERANAHAAAQAAREARSRIESEARARREMLQALERDRSLAMRFAQEMSQAQREMLLAVKARVSSAPGPVNFERLRGRLRWPLAGARIAIPFGDIVHPQFKTTTPHPGATLVFPSPCPAHAPPASCPNERNVRAVAFGRVVFRGRMRGYGQTVVLDHASGYYTVYAGLASVRVAEGAIVREGDILGRVRRLPGENELRLYFEVRQGSEALDPARYLAPRVSQ